MTFLKIGARGSPLSLAQTGLAARELEALNPGLATEIVAIKTTGDRRRDVALADIGGKGLFVKEIEEALLAGDIDLAVHSAKDLPAELPEGLGLGAVPERADCRDVLISRHGHSLAELPQGAKVGTSGLRRQAQLLAARPDLRIAPIRGNVGTRLEKIQAEFEATILAASGLKRLGVSPPGAVVLEPEVMLPAAGQGILALEVRLADKRVLDIIAPLTHRPTALALAAERGFLARLGTGCQLPVAALGVLAGGLMTLEGLIASLDGQKLVRGQKVQTLDSPEEAAALGRSLAEELLARGGEDIMKAL
ncbi:MAG: hydroxymethylbilane synthase [Candidatus Adiutrix sp.]|jgi:hydroxymethylbilane synthase|nr:hydroxymethylbilane synthase [Candidatus Adiutrix sp.]